MHFCQGLCKGLDCVPHKASGIGTTTTSMFFQRAFPKHAENETLCDIKYHTDGQLQAWFELTVACMIVFQLQRIHE